MRLVKIEEWHIDEAKREASRIGKLKNSITNGDGNLAGIIGEIIAASEVGGDIVNTYDYDVVADGIRYDVKTKRCTSPPKEYYEVSVADYNTSQMCDRYLFTRVGFRDGVFGHCFILGWMSPPEYYDRARFLRKGDLDGDNGFIVKADCWNLPISELHSIEF